MIIPYAEQLLRFIRSHGIDFSDNIEEIHTTTPLSYRDYTGTVDGSAYGIIKDYKCPQIGFVSTRSRLGNLFYVVGEINAMAPNKAKQLFRLFLLEGPVAFSPMFGSGVFPCREFVHIHRCQNRNNTGVLTVFGRGLHRNHAVGGPSRIELFVIPHFMIPMQIEVTVLVWSALLFLTGQNLNVHGALGVTLTSMLTCAEFVGQEYLAKKVGNA